MQTDRQTDRQTDSETARQRDSESERERMKAVGAQHQKGHVHHGRQQPHQVAQLEKLVARQPIHACMHICMCVYACVQACVQARAKLPVAPRIVARTASSNTCIGARMTPPTTQCAAHSTKREAAHLTSGKGLLIAMLQSQRENLSVGGRGDQTCFLFFPSPRERETNFGPGGPLEQVR